MRKKLLDIAKAFIYGWIFCVGTTILALISNIFKIDVLSHYNTEWLEFQNNLKAQFEKSTTILSILLSILQLSNNLFVIAWKEIALFSLAFLFPYGDVFGLPIDIFNVSTWPKYMPFKYFFQNHSVNSVDIVDGNDLSDMPLLEEVPPPSSSFSKNSQNQQKMIQRTSSYSSTTTTHPKDSNHSPLQYTSTSSSFPPNSYCHHTSSTGSSYISPRIEQCHPYHLFPSHTINDKSTRKSRDSVEENGHHTHSDHTHDVISDGSILHVYTTDTNDTMATDNTIYVYDPLYGVIPKETQLLWSKSTTTATASVTNGNVTHLTNGSNGTTRVYEGINMYDALSHDSKTYYKDINTNMMKSVDRHTNGNYDQTKNNTIHKDSYKNNDNNDNSVSNGYIPNGVHSTTTLHQQQPVQKQRHIPPVRYTVIK